MEYAAAYTSTALSAAHASWVDDVTSGDEDGELVASEECSRGITVAVIDGDGEYLRAVATVVADAYGDDSGDTSTRSTDDFTYSRCLYSCARLVEGYSDSAAVTDGGATEAEFAEGR